MADYTAEELAELERLAEEDAAVNGTAASMGAGVSPVNPGDARRSIFPPPSATTLAEMAVLEVELAQLRAQLREVQRDLNHTMHLVIVMAERWKISGDELAAAYKATREARDEVRRVVR